MKQFLALGLFATSLSAAPLTIFTNGKIVTVDAAFSITDTMAVDGERLVAVGEQAKAFAKAHPEAKQVDLGGRMDFETKEGADAAPPGLLPWFEHPQRASRGTPIAFGHWSTLGLINQPDLLALDTGCVWGGCLSAMRVDGGRRELVQVRCEQAQRPGA